MGYVTDAQGIVVDGFKVRSICEMCHAIWLKLIKNRLAPKTWGDADMMVKDYFRTHMLVKHLDLGLCHNGWKVDRLATDDYPGWYANHKHAVAVKQEIAPHLKHEAASILVPSTTSATKKKCHTESDTLDRMTNKKIKLADEAPCE
ncbi:hypothetical protein K439DRAFT_1622808 [Ramaria rubella]|nr:hypothetical protein K439DRAFT_1622808 [Ramaria rubella]